MRRRSVGGLLRVGIAALIAVVLLPASAHAMGPPPSTKERIARGFAVGFDVVLMRPFSAVATGIGAVLFVPTALITSPGGKESISEAFEVMVSTPAYNVYGRPLGEF